MSWFVRPGLICRLRGGAATTVIYGRGTAAPELGNIGALLPNNTNAPRVSEGGALQMRNSRRRL